MINIKNFITRSIVTFFGVGRIAYAPGTFGSLCAFPLLIWLLRFAEKRGIFIYYSPLQFIFFIIVILTITGIYAISEYIKIAKNNDPSEVVIDEVVGQLITIVGIFYFFTFIPENMLVSLVLFFKNIYNLIYFKLMSSFILFRLFDILKPWPVSFADQKVKGGFGVMLDDIFAAILAVLAFFVILSICHLF